MAFVFPLINAFSRTNSLSTRSISTNTHSSRFAKMTLRADLDHIALDCKERDKVHAFYRDVLQFEDMQLLDAPFPSVRVSDVTILDFMKSDEPRGLGGANHICFNVAKDDIESLKKRLADAGVRVSKPMLLGGAKGRGWAVYVSDPENNKLEFRYYD